jgi:peroxiredoxin
MSFAAPVVVAGDPAPLFVLPSTSGGRVALHERRDRNPVLLLFFRGFW